MKIFILSLVNLFIFLSNSWAFNPFGNKKIAQIITPKVTIISQKTPPIKPTKKIVIQEIQLQKDQPTKTFKPTFKLQAIMGDLVMINNQILSFGESIDDYNISQISINEVILEKNDNHLILMVHE